MKGFGDQNCEFSFTSWELQVGTTKLRLVVSFSLGGVFVPRHCPGAAIERQASFWPWPTGGTTILRVPNFWCLTGARCTSRSCHMERIRHSRFNVDTWCILSLLFLIVFVSLLFGWIVPSPCLKFSHCHVTFLAMAFA